MERSKDSGSSSSGDSRSGSGSRDGERSRDERSGSSDSSTSSDRNRSDADKSRTETRSETSTSGSSGSKTNVTINNEQRTTIRQTIVSSGGATRVSRRDLGDVRVSVGVTVPRTVTVTKLPPKIVEIVPEYRTYSYFVTDEDVIVIVDPDTYEIVYVIES